MSPPALIYLGPVSEDDSLEQEPVLCEGQPLEPGDVLPLERKRSPWKTFRGTERIIVGSHEKRADILLSGKDIQAEHIRFYLNVEGGPTDIRPLNPDSARINGVAVEALEWTYLHGGEEIEIAGWRFRYEHSSQ